MGIFDKKKLTIFKLGFMDLSWMTLAFTNKNFSTRPCHITMQRTCWYGQHVTKESGIWIQLSYIKSAAGYSVDPPALPSLNWLTGTPRPI